MGCAGTPVVEPTVPSNPPLLGHSSWEQPTKALFRCNQYPLCFWRGLCRFPHVDVHGAKLPVFEQIQAEAIAS